VRTQALVHWSTLPASLATWEDEAQLRARFPAAPAWGQAGHEGGDNVTTSTEEVELPASSTASSSTTRAHVDKEPRGELPMERPRRLRRPSCRLNPQEWAL